MTLGNELSVCDLKYECSKLSRCGTVKLFPGAYERIGKKEKEKRRYIYIRHIIVDLTA